MKAHDSAKWATVDRNVFSRREKRKRRGENFRTPRENGRHCRTALKVSPDFGTVGLHHEHAPFAAVVIRDRLLGLHDFMKERNAFELPAHGKRLVADGLPIRRKEPRIRKMAFDVEDRGRGNAAVIKPAHRVAHASVYVRHESPPRTPPSLRAPVDPQK